MLGDHLTAGKLANAIGCAATGPHPTDRGKPGTQRHLVVDRRGIPLAVVLTYLAARLSKRNTRVYIRLPRPQRGLWLYLSPVARL
jgi:hypothetical protein